MNHRVRSVAWVAVWMVLVLTVLMLPSPREWPIIGDWMSPRYDRIQPVIQPLAHVFLMGVMSVLLMRSFAGQKRVFQVTLTVAIALFAALVFEMMQRFLPVDFGRACDMGDVAFSSIGIFVGCGLSLLYQVRKKG